MKTILFLAVGLIYSNLSLAYMPDESQLNIMDPKLVEKVTIENSTVIVYLTSGKKIVTCEKTNYSKLLITKSQIAHTAEDAIEWDSKLGLGYDTEDKERKCLKAFTVD